MESGKRHLFSCWIIGAHLILWAAVLQLGTSPAMRPFSVILFATFGELWPWLMHGVGALVMVAPFIHGRSRRIYGKAFIMASLVFASMLWGVVTSEVGFYFSFATMTLVILLAASLALLRDALMEP